jgi:hypothetical protein
MATDTADWFDGSFFLLTPLDDTPYRRMGMSYQVEELVVTALAHVVVLASPLTVASCTFQMAGGNIGGRGTSDSITNISA